MKSPRFSSPATADAIISPPSHHEPPLVWQQIDEAIQQVADVITPVWPLKDYVAVNPYAGLSERSFMDARRFLKVFSDCEILMPIAHYAQQFRQGCFGVGDINAALDEVTSSGISVPMSGREIAEKLRSIPSPENTPHQAAAAPNRGRRIRTIAENVTAHSDFAWPEAIREEVSKHCSAHYDDGQAVWPSPWKHLPLYQAWRSAAEHDRNIEVLGLTGFRKYVSQLPHTPEAAIVCSLRRLHIPQPLWTPFLLCQAFSIPGWCAWAKYQDMENTDSVGNDLAGLLAIRLAYDAALSELFSFRVNWDLFVENETASFRASQRELDDDSSLRYTLLRASEIGCRNDLLCSLSPRPAANPQRKLAQMVFCIDVRSERVRRQLETLSGEIETLGFAGFFGMPIGYVPMGETDSKSHVPVLLKPQFQLYEGLNSSDLDCESKAISKRRQIRSWRKLWKKFQSSPVGCFSFVETTGLFYGFGLLARAIGFNAKRVDPRFDGVCTHEHAKLKPTLRSLNKQGITTSRQADLTASMLRNLGLTKDFARLVVFCGHASQTENNPLAAALDCGACGGHSGEPNARLAAALLNQPYIRSALADQHIEIPSDTHFVAGLHNTTTDSIEYFDLDDLPESHRGDLQELVELSTVAAERTRQERMSSVWSKSVSDLVKRASDWSEVRPEWGLAGNAAFIAAPRSLTKNGNLDGRAFLHSYDHKQDPDGTVLETIVTAPMIVAHLINMQYYASTVDNHYFGSGNKAIHNIVGRFGILSGNGGDLRTGLPWQSVHTGEQYQHLPMRLQALIAAPLESIERVIAKHEIIANLLTGGWLHLIALEGGQAYRYVENGNWQAVAVTSDGASKAA